MTDLLAKQTYVERFPLRELKPHPANPRLHDDEAINESIKTNKFVGAIYAQESTKYILSGHGRVEQLLAEGVEVAPVILVDCDDETAERLLLAMNPLPGDKGYNTDLLTELLGHVQDVTGLTGTGYSADDLDNLLALDEQNFEIEEAAFDGDFIESPAESEQRSKRVAQTKASRALREMVVVLDGDRFKELQWAMEVVEAFHSTSTTSDTIFVGMLHYAKELERETEADG